MAPVMPPSPRPSRTSLQPPERLVPLRRLTPAECDLVGFAGPLVLSERHVRWLGPWRPTGRFVVVRHPDQVVLSCSRAELRDLGLAVDRPRRGWRLAIRARMRAVRRPPAPGEGR